MKPGVEVVFGLADAQARADVVGGHVVKVPGTHDCWGIVVDVPIPAAWLTPTARHTDPETSHRAAAGVKADTDRAKALAAHANHPQGLTDFELGDLIGRKQTSAGKRRHELVQAGLVERLDTTRPSDTGADAHVWRITDTGLTEARHLQGDTAA